MIGDLYNFNLPSELIAQQPARPRDSAKLLVYDLKSGAITDSVFSHVEDFLEEQTTLVVNNSKVENCRWLFEASIEIFVLEKVNPYVVRAMVRPGKKFKLGEKLKIFDWLEVETLAIDDDGIRTLKLSARHDDSRLLEFEHIPLPPYIKQDDTLSDEYQTVYAGPTGSLAAPTAGLHFTSKLIKEIKNKHNIAEITLHVGLGTFAKLTEENFALGKLHKEFYYLSGACKKVLASANHITAVGTTSIRTLESVYDEGYSASSGFTDIFIRPGYKFKAVDSIITNFHLPSTSLLMLIAAFLADKKQLSEKEASEELMRVYNHAISKKYRFYSFGDTMLIR